MNSPNFYTKVTKFGRSVDAYIEARSNLVESLIDKLDVVKDRAVTELKTDLKK